MTVLRAAVEAFLQRQGKSQAQWARELGISKQRMTQILDGQANPSLALALRMSELSGVRIEQFASPEECEAGDLHRTA
jgi:DNA-binding XRE family transcriptional regulator